MINRPNSNTHGDSVKDLLEINNRLNCKMHWVGKMIPLAGSHGQLQTWGQLSQTCLSSNFLVTNDGLAAAKNGPSSIHHLLSRLTSYNTRLPGPSAKVAVLNEISIIPPAEKKARIHSRAEQHRFYLHAFHLLKTGMGYFEIIPLLALPYLAFIDQLIQLTLNS